MIFFLILEIFIKKKENILSINLFKVFDVLNCIFLNNDIIFLALFIIITLAISFLKVLILLLLKRLFLFLIIKL